MKLAPHLTFNGQAEAAAKFYAAALGGEITYLSRFGDCMPEVAEEHKQRVTYSSVEFVGGKISICDSMSDEPVDFGKGGHTLDLEFASVPEIEDIYAKLSDGGKIVCPLEKTFFSERFAVVIDKFGVTWNLIVE